MDSYSKEFLQEYFQEFDPVDIDIGTNDIKMKYFYLQIPSYHVITIKNSKKLFDKIHELGCTAYTCIPTQGLFTIQAMDFSQLYQSNETLQNESIFKHDEITIMRKENKRYCECGNSIVIDGHIPDDRR